MKLNATRDLISDVGRRRRTEKRENSFHAIIADITRPLLRRSLGLGRTNEC